jgi:hypothetical protein
MIWSLTATAFNFPREFVEEIENQERNTISDSITKNWSYPHETNVFFGKNRKPEGQEP